MADKKSSARTAADQRFDKAKRTNDEARATIDSEFQAQRKKTAGLKAQRLAKEAADLVLAQETPPAKPKRSKK